MNIRCPSCQTVFRVDPARVPAAGVRARCARCSTAFMVTREGAQQANPSQAGASGTLQSSAPGAAAVAPPRSGGFAGTTAPQPAGAAAPVSPHAPPRPGPATPAASATPAPAPAQASAAPAPPVAQRPSPVAQQPTPVAQRPSPVAQQPAPVAQQPPSAAPPRVGGAATASASGTPIFGSRDPNARAQRIARALVSDIVAYHPKRRDACLEAGTLRTEFREEIMKSWEEYVAQVGLEMAKSTPYFRDSLNAILAKGQPVF
jgi:predicted Zn finger-like uncharacterized protein